VHKTNLAQKAATPNLIYMCVAISGQNRVERRDYNTAVFFCRYGSINIILFSKRA
jgi:hypothetical protein